jgi:hypothetical protein
MRDDLLGPLVNQEWRCAPFARREGLDPVGSAGTYDCVLLVEWPLPWPRDVGEIPEIADAAERIAARAPHRSVRILVVVPPTQADVDERLVTRWWRDPAAASGPYDGTDHECHRTSIADDLAALVTDDGPRGAAAPRDVVICGHGRRDVCCGRAGTVLHDLVRSRWSGVRVRRCSHTGGHRFAPTAFTFPEARGWAYLDEDLLDAIVLREGDAARLAPHYRGWMALDAPAQVAERALLARTGWAWLDARVAASPLAGIDPDAGTSGVQVDWDLAGTVGRAQAGVGIRRRVPTLACGSPPDPATKADPEWELRGLSVGPA